MMQEGSSPHSEIGRRHALAANPAEAFPAKMRLRPEQAPNRAPGQADLHIHTTASDGCLPPGDVVQVAAREGLTAISICDHDTVGGLPEAIAAAEKRGLELIAGLELSTYLPKPVGARGRKTGSEVHILGYFVDYNNEVLAEVLLRLREERIGRVKKMIGLLAELGVTLDTSKIDEAARQGQGSVGRLHVARALVRQGIVGDIKEAFHKYIGRGKPAYVPRAHMSPAEGCKVITDAGGIPVLAHPSRLDRQREIPKLVKEGIMGIEAFFPSLASGGVDPQLAERYCRVAEKWGLLVTGGSDCHQSESGHYLIGRVRLDYKYVEKLKASRRPRP